MILHDDFIISYLCELCELSLRSQWFKISLKPLAVLLREDGAGKRAKLESDGMRE